MQDDIAKDQRAAKPRFRRTKAAVKFLFDPAAWVGTDNLREGLHWITASARSAFKISPRAKVESFAEAVERLKISKENLLKQERAFLRNSWIFAGVTLLLIFYAAYLWTRVGWLINLLSLVVIALSLIQAFRYSFWCYQIKKRTLGCRITDWFKWLLRGTL